MKRNVYFILSLINLGLTLWMLTTLPEMVPTHFNVVGEMDRMGSRWFYLLISLPSAIIMLSYLLYVHLTRNNERALRNRAVEDRLVPMISLLFAVVGWVALLMARGGGDFAPHYMGWIFVVLGLFMVIMSNVMGKLSHNRWMGLKLPWTLKDERVWNKAHRVAGYTGIVGGLIIIAGGLVGLTGQMIAAFCMLIAGILVMVIPPSIYSWRLYNQLHPKG